MTLYTNDCPKCKILKSKLDSKNLTYKTVNDTDLMIEMGFSSIPMLETGGKLLNFLEATQFVNKIEQ